MKYAFIATQLLVRITNDVFQFEVSLFYLSEILNWILYFLIHFPYRRDLTLFNSSDGPMRDIYTLIAIYSNPLLYEFFRNNPNGLIFI